MLKPGFNIISSADIYTDCIPIICIFRLNSDKSRGPDKIRLTELLSAAGIESLNQKSDALNARSRTYRENGIVLRVIIEYANSEKKLFGTKYV